MRDNHAIYLKNKEFWLARSRAQAASGYHAKRRRENPAHVRAVQNKAARKFRAKMFQQKVELQKLLGGVCAKCGFSDPRALDFDHVDPREKKFAVSQMIARQPLELIVEEARKCQLLCANCHRVKTFEYGDTASRRIS